MTGRLAGTQNFSLCQRTPSFAHGSNWPLLARAKLTATQQGGEREGTGEKVKENKWREGCGERKPAV